MQHKITLPTVKWSVNISWIICLVSVLVTPCTYGLEVTDRWAKWFLEFYGDKYHRFNSIKENKPFWRSISYLTTHCGWLKTLIKQHSNLSELKIVTLKMLWRCGTPQHQPPSEYFSIIIFTALLWVMGEELVSTTQ